MKSPKIQVKVVNKIKIRNRYYDLKSFDQLHPKYQKLALYFPYDSLFFVFRGELCTLAEYNAGHCDNLISKSNIEYARIVLSVLFGR